MASEQEFLFFYIFYQLEGTEHIIVESWLNVAALQKVQATSICAFPQAYHSFFVLLVPILGMVGQYWPAANPYPQTPAFHLYPHSFVGGGGWGVCGSREQCLTDRSEGAMRYCSPSGRGREERITVHHI